jgi:hypothetical protein
VQPSLVVGFDPVLDVTAGSCPVGPGVGADLGLDRREERFGGGAVQAGPSAAGALADLKALQRAPIRLRMLHTSKAFAETCHTSGVVQSMGAVGTSADNAAAEALNAAFKRETLQGAHGFTDEREARLAVFGWAHRYNTRRRHSRLGQISSIASENALIEKSATLPLAA